MRKQCRRPEPEVSSSSVKISWNRRKDNHTKALYSVKGLNLLSGTTPVAVLCRLIRSGDTRISGSSPEPAINIDGLEVLSVAAFTFEVAFSTRSIDGAHVFWKIKYNVMRQVA